MAKHKYKKKLRWGTCAYCGIYSEELSEDHVIPKCLFSGHPPTDTPVVYACKKCNSKKKSLDDAYLRDYLVKNLEGSGRLIVPSLREAFERAKEKNHSRFVRDIKYQPLPLFTSTGLFRGFTLAESIPSEQIKAILRSTMRGLYHAYTNKWLPGKIEIEVYRFTDPSHINLHVQDLSQRGGRYVAAGDGSVFECLYGLAKELPSVSLWWLSFNRNDVFAVATNREHLLMGL